ncbi:MAG: hypothetical protein KH284_11560 [Clostridiales bacterium]|nr:hypothetical protein [Clostridiales bacterium]
MKETFTLFVLMRSGRMEVSMSHTDQLLEAICDKMDQLIENQKKLERRLASLERASGQQIKKEKKLSVSVRKPEKE